MLLISLIKSKRNFLLNFVMISTTAILFLSCSLNYNQDNNTESSYPEFSFNKVAFSRYEDSKLSILLEAEQLEQYKDDGNMYGKNVKFNTWDNNDQLETEGSCGLLSINSKDDVYLLFNKIIIISHDQNMQLFAENLKWNSKTEQLISGINDKVTIKRNDLDITGTGFSASGVSKSFSFASSIAGTIQTEQELSQQGDQAE